MRRFTWAIMVMALALVVAACGSDDSESAGADATTVATTEAADANDGEGALAGAPSDDDGEGALAGAVPHEEATEEQLEIWQTDLNAVGCWAGPVDGTMGPQTEAAIKAFQDAKELEVDGLLGPITKAALEDAVTAGEIVCTSDGDTDDGEGAAAGALTIADVVASDGRFSTLLAAVEAAGLTETLADPNATYTVFAPTNDAFVAALDALGLTAEALLANDGLADILLYHVLGDIVTSGDLAAAGEEEIGATTLEGETLWIVISDSGDVSFRDAGGAMVIEADIRASNGVIHVIDGVLLPPSSQM